ncbi:hypothetical protein EON62_01765, partial [archaeon]
MQLGYYCPGNSGNVATSANWVSTVLGQTCAGTISICGCPPGTYGTSTSLKAQTECTTCPPGFYCSGAGSTPSGACAPGYYCPAGSSVATQVACPAGTYSTATNNSLAEHCTVCPVGYYCLTAATAPTQCAAGRYGNTTGLTAASSCPTCPAGWYCPTVGTVNPLLCGYGYYSGASALSCTICPAGRYCPFNNTAASWLPSLQCPAGMYCATGKANEPELTTDPCPKGSYCLQGVSTPAPCPAGTYNLFFGGASLAACIACPAGSYCLAGSVNVTGECAPGYYCVQGSSSPTAAACVATTYRNVTGGRAPTDCSLCPSGSYCGIATSFPTTCPAGYYCTAGVSVPQPCAIGSYSNVTGVRRVEDCAPCSPGMYCPSMGLTQPAGLCAAGYYCLSGSNTSAPAPPGDPFSTIALPIGGRCPAGGYCPSGTSYPLPCPAGTFGNTTGAQS